MKKRIIALSVAVAMIVGVIGLYWLLSGENSIKYGHDGAIVFTESDTDITDFVIGSAGYTVAENENYILRLDGNANINVTHKKSGRVWKAVPDNDMGNSKYSSSLILDYYSDNATKVTLYSSEHCVDTNQVKVFSVENGAKVEYIFGEMASEFIYPETISTKRMEKYFALMSDEDVEFLKRWYNLYMLDLFEGEDRNYLLSKYPRLEKEDIYAIKDVPKSVGRKIDTLFRNVGYTEKDKVSDDSGSETEIERTQTFKVAVNYSLTDNGFQVYINKDDCLFYGEYPVSRIHLLPYFDAFSGGDDGYMVIPSGSGGVVEISDKELLNTQNLSLPIYGPDINLTQNTDENDQQCILPVYGQYKNSSGYFCIVNNAEQQGTIEVERDKIYSSTSASFSVLDNQCVKMTAKTPFWLFASKAADEKFGEEYILLPDLEEKSAYSDMACLYREHLIKSGVLNENKAIDSARLLVEVVNVVNYDKMVMGCIPKNSEFALTSFKDTKRITDDILKFADSNSIELMLMGWNSFGINRQAYKTVDFSKVAGGKGGFEALKKYFNEKRINAYCDVNFTFTDVFSGDKYSPASGSAKGINKSITKLNLKNPQTNSYSQSGIQIISPNLYTELAKAYIDSEEFKGMGLGVSQLTSYLCSDYTDGNESTRKDTKNNVAKVLSELTANERKIIGNTGNLYTLKYLSVVNNLSVTSNKNNIFDYDIPFIQMVLHGSVDYVSTPINDAADAKETVLKLIETGSGLHVKATANSFDKLFETDYSELYSTLWTNNKDTVKEAYTTLTTALQGLGDKQILSHGRLADGVTCTEYENGVKIYVNYNNTEYYSGDIKIAPLSYLRK